MSEKLPPGLPKIAYVDVGERRGDRVIVKIDRDLGKFWTVPEAAYLRDDFTFDLKEHKP